MPTDTVNVSDQLFEAVANSAVISASLVTDGPLPPILAMVDVKGELYCVNAVAREEET